MEVLDDQELRKRQVGVADLTTARFEADGSMVVKLPPMRPPEAGPGILHIRHRLEP